MVLMNSLMGSPSVPTVLHLAFSLGYNHRGSEQQLWTQVAGRVGAYSPVLCQPEQSRAPRHQRWLNAELNRQGGLCCGIYGRSLIKKQISLPRCSFSSSPDKKSCDYFRGTVGPLEMTLGN